MRGAGKVRDEDLSAAFWEYYTINTHFLKTLKNGIVPCEKRCTNKVSNSRLVKCSRTAA